MNKNIAQNKQSQIAFFAMLWVLPLLMGILWGPYFDADVYGVLRQTRTIIRQPAISTEPLTSPLYTLALIVPTALGLPTHIAGLVLSCLGWGLAATTIYHIGGAIQRPHAGAIAALLTISSPLVTQTLGSGISWSVALMCLALSATIERRWWHHTVALLLLLTSHSGIATLGSIALLWSMWWHIEGRPARRLIATSAIAILIWITAAALGFVTTPQLKFDEYTWIEALRTLIRTSELYWLFIPWIIIGAWKMPHKAVWAIWLVAILIDGSETARAAAATLALWFTAMGIDATLKWLHQHKITRLSYRTLMMWGTCLMGLPLLVALGTTLTQTYAYRPLAQYALLQQAGIWLRDTTSKETFIYGPEVMAYWAERNAVTWEGTDGTPEQLAQQLSRLNTDVPDHCVTSTGFPWTQLTRLRAFRNLYAPVHILSASHSPHTVTVWQRRFPAAKQESATQLNVDLPGGIKLVGFRHIPEHAAPGEPVYITLSLQAAEPITQSFYARLSLRSPLNGLIHGQHGVLLPQSTLVSWWNPGQIIAETIPVTTTSELPVGAYHVILDVHTPDKETVLPLHQDDDTAVLVEVALGNIARPWQGTLINAQSANADFGEQIQLVGFDAPNVVTSGNALDVTLYWKTIQSPGEDYTVFVHLLDDDGQLISSHDGQPMGGRYPTGAWLPGDTVPDTHSLNIDSGLPAGIYRLNVGMYQRPSLERLIVRDADGNEQPDRVFFLRTVTIP